MFDQLDERQETQPIEDFPKCLCYDHERSTFDRPALWIPIVIVMFVSLFFLLTMADLPYGVQLGSLIPYTAFVGGWPGSRGVSLSTKTGCPRCLAFGHLGEQEPQPGFRKTPILDRCQIPISLAEGGLLPLSCYRGRYLFLTLFRADDRQCGNLERQSPMFRLRRAALNMTGV
jgi:hypothetical protein